MICEVAIEFRIWFLPIENEMLSQFLLGCGLKSNILKIFLMKFYDDIFDNTFCLIFLTIFFDGFHINLF